MDCCGRLRAVRLMGRLLLKRTLRVFMEAFSRERIDRLCDRCLVFVGMGST
jgi:hypothetical protein